MDAVKERRNGVEGKVSSDRLELGRSEGESVAVGELV